MAIPFRFALGHTRYTRTSEFDRQCQCTDLPPGVFHGKMQLCGIAGAAGSDPLEILAGLADLPPEQQESFLFLMGQELQGTTEGLVCPVRMIALQLDAMTPLGSIHHRHLS
jgi:hypothetical protein